VIDFKLFSPRRDRTAAMPFIMLTVLIDMVSIGLIIPVLPSLVGGFTGSQADQAFWYGVVVFAFGIANFIGSPILGALSDAYGRRPILLLGFCGLGLNFFATGLSTALWMLIAVRLVGGAMQANAAVAMWRISPLPKNAPSASACWAPCSGPASSSGRSWAACLAPSLSSSLFSWLVVLR
jgi:DHA1 family tetracycline resistance protein-like MFS transporter